MLYICGWFEKAKLEPLKIKDERRIMMSNLREESLKECVSLLMAFIQNPQDKEKEIASRALEELITIMAATMAATNPPDRTCVGRPKVHG
jgi:hypothetical protein